LTRLQVHDVARLIVGTPRLSSENLAAAYPAEWARPGLRSHRRRDLTLY